MVMDEGSGKAIPLRRSRTAARPVVVRPPVGEALSTRVLAAPRQVWLAALGSAGFTLRGARTTWDRLVSEGEAVEGRLRRTLGRG
jgi:hypothetical protein